MEFQWRMHVENYFYLEVFIILLQDGHLAGAFIYAASYIFILSFNPQNRN